jgi:hypothetical protein
VGVGLSEEGAYSSGVDSILRFWLERGGDGTKHCQKMKLLGSDSRKLLDPKHGENVKVG